MAISVRARFRNAMIGLALTLCVIFTLLLFVIVFTTEDQIFMNQLVAEKSLYQTHLSQHPGVAWTPSNRRFQLLDASGALPPFLPEAIRARVGARTGVHEYFDADRALFIDHFKRPGSDRSEYLVYDVSDLLAVRGNKLPIFATIAILTLIVTLCSIVITHRLVRTTLTPVRKLTHELQHGELDEVVIELANQFSEDEIGILTHELALALERVRAAAQREYEFNRGVSHELRSPIQAALSATELLELHAGDQDRHIGQIVARLKRSITEMNEVAETFLWLASDRDHHTSTGCSVSALRRIVASVDASVPTQTINFDTSLTSSYVYAMPENVAGVLIRNLLRNGISHGRGRAISVTVTETRISVTNTLPDAPMEEAGFGVGLTILDRICNRFGYTLAVEHDHQSSYTASIVFESSK